MWIAQRRRCLIASWGADTVRYAGWFGRADGVRTRPYGLQGFMAVPAARSPQLTRACSRRYLIRNPDQAAAIRTVFRTDRRRFVRVPDRIADAQPCHAPRGPTQRLAIGTRVPSTRTARWWAYRVNGRCGSDHARDGECYRLRGKLPSSGWAQWVQPVGATGRRPMLDLVKRVFVRRRDDRGASGVEYGLLIAAIAAVVVALAFVIGQFVQEGFSDTCDALEASESVGEAATCP